MKLKYKFIIQEVAGSYMAVAIGDGAENFKGMIRLNATGKRIFELIQDGQEPDAIVSTLMQEYDAPEAELRKSVNTLVENMKSANILA